MNTEFITKTAKVYSPVILRGSLWIGIAVLTDFRHALTDMVTKPILTALDWTECLSGAALQGLIAWRLFLDQSYHRWQEETKGKT